MKITRILISLILIESSFAQGMAPRDWGLIVVDFNGDGIVDEKDGENGLDSDMIRAIKRIEDLTGVKPEYVRPTYGSHNNATNSIYKKNGLKMIFWDIDSADCLRRYSPGADLAASLRSKIRQSIIREKTGVIVLFHDIKYPTQRYLDDYLIAMYEGAQDAGKIAVFPSTPGEFVKFLKEY